MNGRYNLLDNLDEWEGRVLYESEQDLVDEFTALLLKQSESFGTLTQLAFEFPHQPSRTDIIALSVEGLIVAFEAKLLNWRTALDQAYRNTRFAHYSYVLLPADAAAGAARFILEFARRGIGLCTIEAGEVKVLQPARRTEPLQSWLSERAVAYISRSSAG